MADPEDTANSAPAQELQRSGADIFAGLVAADSRTRVELSAADYSLGSLGFATPALFQTHKLSVTDYIMGPPVFSAPVWRYGFGRQQVHWIDAGSGIALGRPRHIPKGDVPDLIAKMERWLIEKQAKTFHRLTRGELAVVEYARKLVSDAGIETSDTTLLRQIIRPAFQKFEKPD